MTIFQKKLFSLQDTKYRDFHSRLIPTVDKETIIGVRVPLMRRYARELLKSGDYKEFIAELPHRFYDENILHAIILSYINDYRECLGETERFLPYIDNWAVCDTLTPRTLLENQDEFLKYIYKWTDSALTYTIRFGLKMLMQFYLDERFRPEFVELPLKISSDKYYVRMMTAWFYQEALSKRWDDFVYILTEQRLDKWTHNMTIRKCTESFKITEEQKAILRNLRR